MEKLIRSMLIARTAGAVAVHRCRFPGRNALVAAILSPLMLPGLVLGIAMLQGYRRYGLDDAFVALLMALPWIGWLFRGLALVAGFGALVVERWDFLSRLRAQGLA